MTAAVDENIRLIKGHRCNEKQRKVRTYPFQVSVGCVVCMEVVETFRHVQQLEEILSVKCQLQKKTYQANSICAWIFVGIVGYCSIRHPFRNQLQGILRNSDECNDVRMLQPFPRDSLLVKRLRDDRHPRRARKDNPTQNTNLLDRLTNFLRNPRVLDADLAAVVSAFPYFGEATEGEWMIPHSGEIA